MALNDFEHNGKYSTVSTNNRYFFAKSYHHARELDWDKLEDSENGKMSPVRKL